LLSTARKVMKITIDIPDEIPAKAVERLAAAFDGLVQEELRRTRREFRIGDWVVDGYGQRLQISDIYPEDPPWSSAPTEYDLSDGDGRRFWKAATADKFGFPED